MSRKNRHKQQMVAKPAVVSRSNSQAGSVTETAVDKRQDRRITWTQIGASVSVVVSVASAIIAYRSAQSAEAANKLAQVAHDRATGRIPARFDLVYEKNPDMESMKQFMRKEDGSDQLVFRIESADELMRWAPYVRVRNIGDESIDAIKTDVHYDLGKAYGMGVKQIDPIPIVVNEPSSYAATTFGKLLHGQTATISLSPILMNQIARLNLKDYADKDHFGIFTIRVYCRLVGTSSYDRAPEDQTEMLKFHWRPAGFQPDAKHVKELLNTKPSVRVD